MLIASHLKMVGITLAVDIGLLHANAGAPRHHVSCVGLVDGIAFTHHLLDGAAFAFAFPLSVSVRGRSILEELICGFISVGR